MVLREGLTGTVLLVESRSSCVQALLLSGWERILAGSLGSGVKPGKCTLFSLICCVRQTLLSFSGVALRHHSPQDPGPQVLQKVPELGRPHL